MVKLTEEQRSILSVLNQTDDDYNCLYFENINKKAKIGDIKKTRRIVRRLKRMGLAEFHRGLFNDDGEVAGSGYCISEAGRRLLNEDGQGKASSSIQGE